MRYFRSTAAPPPSKNPSSAHTVSWFAGVIILCLWAIHYPAFVGALTWIWSLSKFILVPRCLLLYQYNCNISVIFLLFWQYYAKFRGFPPLYKVSSCPREIMPFCPWEIISVRGLEEEEEEEEKRRRRRRRRRRKKQKKLHCNRNAYLCSTML